MVGAGHADKTQIAFMVKRLLPAAGDVKADAADALAVALTHAQLRKRALLVPPPLEEGDHAKHGGGGQARTKEPGVSPLHRFAVPLPQRGRITS